MLLLLQDEDEEQVIVEYVTEQPALDFLQPEEAAEDEEEAAYGPLLGLGAPGLGLGATPKPAPPVSSSRGIAAEGFLGLTAAAAAAHV